MPIPVQWNEWYNNWACMLHCSATRRMFPTLVCHYYAGARSFHTNFTAQIACISCCRWLIQHTQWIRTASFFRAGSRSMRIVIVIQAKCWITNMMKINIRKAYGMRCSCKCICAVNVPNLKMIENSRFCCLKLFITSRMYKRKWSNLDNIYFQKIRKLLNK